MSTITFYEKPGCATNAKQKRLLLAAGHELVVRSLLTEPWTAERLREFFGGLPVALWINRAAPKVKSGEIDPARLTEASAMALLLSEPLHIRRPLMEVGPARLVGFDPAVLRAHISLPEEQVPAGDLQGCSRQPATGAAG